MKKFGSIEIDEKLGGYEIVNLPADKMPQDLASALYDINSSLGATYSPIWYYGNNLVNGVNHLLICKEVRSTKNKDTSIVGVVINIPFGEVGGKGAKVVEVIEEAKLPPEIKTIFDNAVSQYVGVGLKPLVYVGEQVVKGKNYYFICQAHEIYKDVTDPYAVVVCINVFEDRYVVKGVVPIPVNSKDTICGYAFTW